MRRSLLVVVVIATFFSAGHAHGKERAKVLLKPETCREISESESAKLPSVWRPYIGFIKACQIFASGALEVDIISIWLLDYFQSKYPEGAAPVMESFPMPVIVNQDLKVLGTLPEYYPDDPPRELEIYYSDKTTIPPDLYIKVYNPGAGGDYSYPPMTWNVRKGSYFKCGSACVTRCRTEANETSKFDVRR